MSMKVFWSDRLEKLAEGLFCQWDAVSSQNPFSRICIVVGDMATRNWLRHYFLFQRKEGSRKILANVDFKPIAEFANDWLAAQTHEDGAVKGRTPADHPYAKGVLTWRIDALLRTHADDPELKVLASYVKGRDVRVETRRRYELAARLAELYDDYLGGRFRMLADWERGNLPSGADRWQGILYRLLVAETPETYTRDYMKALAPESDAARALAHGFPRYETIHVFDVATAPWPYLEMLAKIAMVTPVTFWNFNPSKDYWLDDPTKRGAMRNFARSLRKALMTGETPPDLDRENMFASPDLKLLGALASGARGVLSAELDLDENGCDWLGDENAGDFDALRTASPEVHICHSPRRELEVARDALHRFFRDHPEARPCDAQILCADWATYSPLVESIFGSENSGSLPVFIDGCEQVETPITHSLGDILAFRDNRFGVNAVFALLGVPEIRNRFEIDAEGLSVLRDMVRKSNIHWGYDDADVRMILGDAGDGTVCSFTWRRGLDRLALDALLGPRSDVREVVDAGAIGRLQPCGNVEEERARLVGRLNAFVMALADLRTFLQADHLPEEWGERLTQAIDDFYRADGEAMRELSSLRRAVDSVVRDAVNARRFAGLAPQPVSGEIFCRTVRAAVRNGPCHDSSAGDAIRIAPLTIGTAVPARFVWICGLSDGTFPRCAYRPSFDLIGRHPTFFDITVRERDTLALLKAAMGAREQLSFSYVGRSLHSNDKLPAAVPLIDLMEWFESTGVTLRVYQHPLQTFSPRYFLPPETQESALPPSFSAVDRDAAVAIEEKRGAQEIAADALPEVRPFSLSDSGDTVIDVEELVGFYSRPNSFLAKERLGIRISEAKYDLLSDDDEITSELPRELKFELTIGGMNVVDPDAEAERLREEGCSVSVDELKTAMRDLTAETESYRARPLDFTKAQREGFACEEKSLAEALVDYRKGGTMVPYHVGLEIDGKSVVVNGCRTEMELNVVPSGRLPHVFSYSQEREIYPSQQIGAWIRHVAGHAAGGRFVTVMMCGKDGTSPTLRPLDKDEAKAELAKIVAQALKPMPFDIGLVCRKDDEPTGEFAEAVSGYSERIVRTRGTKVRGR